MRLVGSEIVVCSGVLLFYGIVLWCEKGVLIRVLWFYVDAVCGRSWCRGLEEEMSESGADADQKHFDV